MFLVNVVALAFVALTATEHPPRRHPARTEVVTAHELVIEPIESADAKAIAPIPVVVRPAKPPTETPDFRAAVARQLETLPICRRAGGPEGPGLAEVTYLPNGTARISLSGNYASSPSGACVARRFANAAMPFEGEPVTLKIRFEV